MALKKWKLQFSHTQYRNHPILFDLIETKQYLHHHHKCPPNSDAQHIISALGSVGFTVLLRFCILPLIEYDYLTGRLKKLIILIISNNQWFPAVDCPLTMVHKECGSACQRRCGASNTACTDTSCIDGCFCPDGHVMLNNTCVRPEQCPCMNNNHEYRTGEVIPKDCNKWFVWKI